MVGEKFVFCGVIGDVGCNGFECACPGSTWETVVDAGDRAGKLFKCIVYICFSYGCFYEEFD